MTDSELIALIEREEANCISSTTGALAEQRREAMQYYYRQPYGNEIEGRSQVVTSEVMDSVEGIMPRLMAIFTSAEEIVRCDPQNPDDEEAAQQATDYLNYVFSRINNGFLVLYCLFKDALLQKNGYAKAYWEDYTDNGIETYENIAILQVAMLLQQGELELGDYEINEQNPEEFKKVELRRNKKYGKICIDPAPPEEIMISRDTPNELSKARFVEHRTLKTISEVRQMGYDVDDQIADYSNADTSLERVERFRFDDADANKVKDETADPATRRVWLCEAYLYVDFDKDGIAEYRKVTKIGKTVLDNEEFDSLPIIGGTAVLMPHKHYGLSVHDLVGDIQLIKSTVTRNLLDNAYVANNGRMAVLDGMVNMEDLLTSRPNGIIRMKAMGAVTRLDNPLLGAPFYNLLEYFDKVKVNRVGSRDFGDAIDPNALNAKAHTAEIVENAAQERINLMARILAETVVKPLFWKILELVSKHQQKPQMVKLRGKWVQVDPRLWKNRFDMTVTVGLGTGSQQAVLAGVTTLGNLMQGAIQLGYGRIFPEQVVYNLIHTAAKAIFPRNADQYAVNPQTLPPPQPQPNPEMMKLQLAAHKAEMGDAQKRDKMAMDAQLTQMGNQLEAWKTQFQASVDAMKQQKDHNADAAKAVLDMANEQRRILTEKLAELRLQADAKTADQENLLLQGKLDLLAQKLDQQHELQIKTMEIAQADRETEVAARDEKGKVKKTVSRIKK